MRKKYEYIPEGSIESITTKSGDVIKSKDILDGAHVKMRKPKPKAKAKSSKIPYSKASQSIMSKVNSIWDDMDIQSGSQIYGDEELQKRYIDRLSVIDDIFLSSSNKQKTLDELTDENYHNVVAYLSIKFDPSARKTYSQLYKQYKTTLNPKLINQDFKHGGVPVTFRTLTLSQKAEQLVGTSTWNKLQNDEKEEVIADFVSQGVITMNYAVGGDVEYAEGGGIDDWFWNYEYRHYLRDATPKKRSIVKQKFIEKGLELDGSSPKHAYIVVSTIKPSDLKFFEKVGSDGIKYAKGGGVADKEMKGSTYANGGGVGDYDAVIPYKVPKEEFDNFINYVYNAYKNEGYTKAEVKVAVMKYMRDLDKQYTWGYGDTLDRERVLEYLINPKLNKIKNPTFAGGGGVAEAKYKVTFQMSGASKEKMFDSKEKADAFVELMSDDEDVKNLKLEEVKEKVNQLSSLLALAKPAAPKSGSKKEKESVQISGIASDIARYDELKEIEKNAKAEQELIGGRLKQIGKEKFIELYESRRMKPDNFNLADGDEKILFIVMDKYIKVEPEKAGILEEYDGLLEQTTEFKLNKEVLERVGETVFKIIMESKLLSEEDKRNLLIKEESMQVKKGSINRLLEYDDPALICDLIEPVLALK
jgi:hypothetical protein